MIAASKIGLSAKLVAPLDIASDFIRLSGDVVAAWIPEDGTYYYATITNGTVREHVKVTGYVSGKGLIVQRAQDNTVVGNFPQGSCINVEWNPQQLLDFLAGRQQTTPQIKPGVYCLGCNTCITLNADGTIKEIQDAISC